MDAAYLKAAHPEPFRILGKQLKPFCLGHELLFQRFGIRFSVESTEEPDVTDLVKAVFICSQRYRKNFDFENFSIPIRARIYTFWSGPLYIDKAMGLFKQYIAAHSEIPDFYVPDDGPREKVGSPTIHAVKVSLMANLGLSEDEALNTPLSLAFWNHLAWMESKGEIQIIDEAEVARQKKSDEEYAAMQGTLEAIAEKMREEARQEVSCSA